MGHPTYTFNGDLGQAGEAPHTVWIGGTVEQGIYHAFTRDYIFCDAYRYIGVRSSTVSISATDGLGDRADGDPELDAVFGFDPVQ
jgi:hypothetical protein